MNLIEALNWRYATKKMNGESVPEDKLNRILEAIRLAPTSLGLQPFEVFVISDKKLLKKIQPIAMNQSQIATCSHLLVFTTKKQITREDVDSYIQLMAQERKVSLESLSKFRDMILDAINNKSDEEILAWNSRQTYIALGHGIVAAAMEKVDACPMEGFYPDQMDELLGLPEKGLKSTVLLALGFRDSNNDRLAHMKKVRKPKNKLFHFIQEEIPEAVK